MLSVLAEDQWHNFTNGGRVDTGINAVEWAKEAYKEEQEKFFLPRWTQMVLNQASRIFSLKKSVNS